MATGWRIGERIENRWEIHDILGGPGRSGMGVVYVVYEHEFHAAYAAKTFQDAVIAGSRPFAERFRQEALTWVNFDAHENVTEAHFVYNIAGKPYLFLEYVEGGDLGRWVGTPRLTEDLPQVLRFALQFCDGMTHALSKGVTAHRDVKPQNCLITQDKTLKVTDFGLAKLFDGDAPAEMPQPHGARPGLSRTGAAAGTATHMAPEQFDDAKHVDVRADIYSFGVMLFQMLTGALPFEGRNFVEFRGLHEGQPAPSLGGRLSRFNPLVQRCLAKEPSRGHRTFAEVREELARLYEALTNEMAPSPATGAALDVARRPRAHPRPTSRQLVVEQGRSLKQGGALRAGA